MTSMEAHVKASLGEPTTLREIALDAQGVVSLLQIRDSRCDGATTIVTAGLADLAGHRLHGSSMDSIYVCEPTYFPSDFTRFESTEGCEIHTRWLIPIHASEAQVVAGQGARVREELLENQDPDLLSLQRDPVSS